MNPDQTTPKAQSGSILFAAKMAITCQFVETVKVGSGLLEFDREYALS